MKIELKSKETGNKISFELKEVTMPLREEFVDAYMEAEGKEPQKFSSWVNCVRIITTLTDEELLKLTDLDIVYIAIESMLVVNNKKKDKK
tara:strand:+ start:410 stop:679 length:270 start_codon:yes stop_codon:yes gene_type:complete